MRHACLLGILILLSGLAFEPVFTGAQMGEVAPAQPAEKVVVQLSAAPTTAPVALSIPGKVDLAASEPNRVTPAPATQPSIVTTSGQDGFWQIVQTEDGVWWFRSPDGKLEWLNTVTTVQPFQAARDIEGPAFVSRDWDGGVGTEGNINAWAVATLARLREYGFKGIGAWSHPIFHEMEVPVSRDLNLWKWASERARLYEPEFATRIENAVKIQVTPFKTNRHLLGYFIDNELDWGDGGVGPSIYFDHLPANDPNRIEVMKVILGVWTTVEQFNKDWQTNIVDFKDIDAWTALPHPDTNAYGRLFSAWLSHLAEDYFRITCTAIRKHDPNHLILGVRFKGYAPLEVCRASRQWTDAQSINYYVGDGRLDYEMFKQMHDLSNQPIMIGEYSFHALDGRSGNRNTVGFSAQVLDQQARADGYEAFTTRMAKVPWMIGADWFQWADEPPSGRSSDGEDVNFGIVDVDDRAYGALVAAVQRTSGQLNPLHEKSPTADQSNIWRESFATKPVADVPYLAKKIRLNGELSDWPAMAKVSGIRHSQTIGLDRSKIPLPNLYVGWREEGLYLGMEVFDNDIQGAPAQGWWWTRDHVEFWVNTRPVAPEQTGYDAYSHQFFFVPIDFPASDGIAGVIGRWHRAGDALKDSIIPHPLIKDSVRVMPDRYVVEMFVPKEAMDHFNPNEQPELAFNIHVRNFQHAIDYFWSAPKEVMTQLRPATWGTLNLLSPDKTSVLVKQRDASLAQGE